MRYLLCASIVALFPCVAAAQTPVIAVPEKIKAEGLPPIPQAIADDLSRYANFREAQFLAWHPTKQQILIQTTFGAFPQLHVVDGPGRARTQLTFFPDGISREFAWARFDPADGATVLLRKDTGGGKETNQLFRYDVTSGATTLVTDGKSRFGTPVWSRQGKWIAYDSTERNGRDHDLYVMQPADPKSARRIVELQGVWEALDWSPDGAAVLALEQVGDAETYLWRVDVKTGEKKPLTPRGQATAEWADGAVQRGRPIGLCHQRQRERSVSAVARRRCVWRVGGPDVRDGRRGSQRGFRSVLRRPDDRHRLRSRQPE